MMTAYLLEIVDVLITEDNPHGAAVVTFVTRFARG